MGLFGKKEICPLCDKPFGLTNLKFKLDNGENICQTCATDLVGIWKKDQDPLKSLSIYELKEMYKKKGLVAFNPTEKVTSGFMSMSFDDKNKMFAIKPNATTPEYKGKYEELQSYELIENNKVKTKSGLGKAIAGGVIAGPAGMIAGAVIGKGQQGPTVINSLSVKVTLKNGTYYPLIFISKTTKSDSLTAKVALTNVSKLTNKLNKIISSTETTQQIEQSLSAPQTSSSAADEIRKFKDLLDDGIITQEEFDAKKKELLGL